MASLNLPKLIALCVQVTDIPDKINTAVLNAGNSNVSIGYIPAGG
jgi:hypothetical protein